MLILPKMTMTMTTSVFDLYKVLKEDIAATSDAYNVKSLPGLGNHRIGISPDGYPMFFVKCSDNNKTSDIRLDMVDVLFNRPCVVKENEKKHLENVTFTIIQLKNSQEDFQKYFVNVVYIVLLDLGNTPKTITLKKEIATLIQLFNSPKDISPETIRGLWGELFVIEQSSNPAYLINSWHVMPEGKYDFNDGENKLEVKASSTATRSHIFSLEQLNPNEGSNLIIASMFVIQTGIGKNIIDLVESISKRLTDNDALGKLQQIILKTVGTHFEKIKNMNFDYSMARDSYALFDYKSIPTINKNNIPATVCQVHFRSDLSEVASLDKEALNDLLYISL